MDNKSVFALNNRVVWGNIAGWLFGTIALAIGIINTIWGNDPGYGVFVMLLSFVYFPPAAALIKRVSGISLSLIIKILLAVFIVWSALGVGELFAKIDLMMKDF